MIVTEAGIGALRGRVVSPRRWLRAVAVIGATAMLLASSCTWQLSLFIPDGVPPPPGDPVPPVDTHAGGRPADQLREWAEKRAAALGIPVIALEAYAYAARVAEVENPKCHLAWTTLAGIGRVESHHGTYRGATIAPNGDVSPPIRASASTAPAAPCASWTGTGAAWTVTPRWSVRWGQCSSFRKPGGCTGSLPETTASPTSTTSMMLPSRQRAIYAGVERISRHREGG